MFTDTKAAEHVFNGSLPYCLHITNFPPTPSFTCIEICENKCVLFEIPPPKGKGYKQIHNLGYKYLVNLNHSVLFIPWIC